MKESKTKKQQRKLLELGVMEKEDTLIDFSRQVMWNA